jgi:hypothetical protein
MKKWALAVSLYKYPCDAAPKFGVTPDMRPDNLENCTRLIQPSAKAVTDYSYINQLAFKADHYFRLSVTAWGYSQ